MSVSPDLVERFSENVARQPQAAAVEAHDGALTYGELDRRSNRLAHHLGALGIGPGSRVAVSMIRGCGELVALLAVAKAGAAYVPLAPSLPLERLQMLVHDAAPDLLLVSSATPLEADDRERTLVLDRLDLDALPVTRPEVAIDPEDLQYVMFTSGSTGRPKGVEIPRAAFSNFLGSMEHTPGLAADDRLLAVTTTSFDIAGLELFLPLWVGATVVIADLETARDPRLLRRLLEVSAITTMQATPATWRLLLEAGWRGDGKLRILCGGEAMSRALADRLLAAGGELWNMYGPTETTVWSSVQRIRRGDDRITIGRPIDRTRLYVLDVDGRPLPPGAEGEIGIGGRGVARGYRDRPALTRERFIERDGPDPDRIYRTGDLGRELPDGRLEWLGRLDHQVKLRGHRVELGEVESVLRAVTGVSEVLVVAELHESGDPRLVAYWVGEASREALVDAARLRLPAYMRPAGYVPLEAFPMNANGKIDRNALPRATVLTDGETLTRRPRTDEETRIAAIWRDVLGMPDVPVDQDFFTLGGSSVLAIQVVSRIEREMGVEIPL
jgi:amino acid adenylation domain-containing protein